MQAGDVSRETSSNDPAWATWHSPLAHAEGRQRVGTTRLCRGDCSSDSRASSLGKGSTSNLLNPRTHVGRGVRGEGIAHTLGLRIHHKKWLQRTRAMTGGDACSTRAHSGSKLSQGGTGDTTISCCPTSDNAPILFKGTMASSSSPTARRPTGREEEEVQGGQHQPVLPPSNLSPASTGAGG